MTENWDDAFVIDHGGDKRIGPVKFYRSWIDPVKARAVAMSKLTDEEQELLGLKKKKPENVGHPPFDHWPPR